MEPPWHGGTNISNDPGHMTKTAAMPIYGKNFKKIIFSGTKKSMTLKFGMQYRVLEYYQACPTDDPELILFHGKIKFGPLCFCMGKRFCILYWSFTAQSITRSCRAGQLIVALFLGRLRPSKRLTTTKRGRPRQ